MKSETKLSDVTSDRCICGRRKLRDFPFCKDDYLRLPKADRIKLYKSMQSFLAVYDKKREMISESYHEKH